MGLSIDWSREIATCDKLYFQNQQKLLEFYRKNLIYKKEFVNWDQLKIRYLRTNKSLMARVGVQGLR